MIIFGSVSGVSMSIRNDLNITRVGVIFSLEFNEICNIRVYQLSPEDVAMSRAYV